MKGMLSVREQSRFQLQNYRWTWAKGRWMAAAPMVLFVRKSFYLSIKSEELFSSFKFSNNYRLCCFHNLAPPPTTSPTPLAEKLCLVISSSIFDIDFINSLIIAFRSCILPVFIKAAFVINYPLHKWAETLWCARCSVTLSSGGLKNARARRIYQDA